MLCLIPESIPPLPLLLDDIGCSSSRKVKDLAKALSVSEATVRRWRKQRTAPRPVMLALFWLTRWGQSAVDCHAHNDAVMHAGMARALKAEVEGLKVQLAKLGSLGDFGSANDPVPGLRGVVGPQAPALTFPPIRFPEEPAAPIHGKPRATTPVQPVSLKQPRRSARG
jgi:predicted DNA-binding transcriptional regulator AlpA